MPLFTSKKEKLLWILASMSLIAIYGSIGIVKPVSSVLRDYGLLTPLFVFGVLLIMATVLYLGLNKNPSNLLVGVYLGIFAVYLMVLVRIELAEERTHIIEYSVVGIFVFQAVLERKRQNISKPNRNPKTKVCKSLKFQLFATSRVQKLYWLQNNKVLCSAVAAIFITGIAGVVDELIQYIIPTRVFDIRDILFNVLAGIMAVLSCVILNWVRTKL